MGVVLEVVEARAKDATSTLLEVKTPDEKN
jgi:hypothetical protein